MFVSGTTYFATVMYCWAFHGMWKCKILSFKYKH